jgi:hypothetical protein
MVLGEQMDNELLKQRVKGKVYRIFNNGDPNLWYKCDDGFLFSIPEEDTHNSQGDEPVFLPEDKAIYFMRWIRKAMLQVE